MLPEGCTRAVSGLQCEFRPKAKQPSLSTTDADRWANTGMRLCTWLSIGWVFLPTVINCLGVLR